MKYCYQGRTLLSLFCLLLIAAACSRSTVEVPTQPLPPSPPPVTVDDDTRDYGPYAAYPEGYSKTLNVVYFLPSDYRGPLNQYQRRLSRMLLFMQEWYRKEMRRHGFGEKTFGLMRSIRQPDFVRITVIRGKENRYGYPYNGGGGKAIAEINAYYATHPQEKSSEHYLVFMPSITGDGKGNGEGGVPFYGIGRFAFVLDYRYFDVSLFPEKKDTINPSWIAGTVHELGHGLNLPHNTQKASDDFVSLMHSHMAFESQHTRSHLTYADACLLNTCEVFNASGHPYYRGGARLELNRLHLSADAEKIYFRSKFMAAPRVTSVVLYHDPKTSEGDGDYNAVTWATSEVLQTADGLDSVALDMSVADLLAEYRLHPLELRVRFCHEDGSFTVNRYAYAFQNGVASIHEEVFPFDALPVQGWIAAATSSNSDAPVSRLFDGNTATIWHSRWQGGVDPLPHTITINLGAVQTIKGIALTARQDRSDGRPETVTFEVSANGTEWSEVLASRWRDTPTHQMQTLRAAVTARYVRLRIETVYAGSIPQPQYAHLAELQLF